MLFLKREKSLRGNNLKVKVSIAIIVAILFACLLTIILINQNLTVTKTEETTKLDSVATIGEEDTKIGEVAKISSAQIIKRVTGTGPWDNDDTAGNDSSESNNIVRSFDQVTWTIENTMALKETVTEENYKGGVIEIKAELPENCASVTTWDLESMKWAENANVSENGRIFTAHYSMSKTEVTVPGKQTLVFVLKVLGAPNALDIKPTFTVGLVGNLENEKVIVNEADSVKVSASPNYNIVLGSNTGSLSSKTTVNYDGKETKGRMYGFGFRVELLNLSKDKGLKGIEYPKGDITFDIDLKLERSGFQDAQQEDITDKCTPILWDYRANDWNRGLQGNEPGRNMYTNGNGYSLYINSFPLGVKGDRTYTVNNSRKHKNGTTRCKNKSYNFKL